MDEGAGDQLVSQKDKGPEQGSKQNEEQQIDQSAEQSNNISQHNQSQQNNELLPDGPIDQSPSNGPLANSSSSQQQSQQQQKIQSQASTSIDLYSTERWGIAPIRQDTPWDLPPSPNQTASSASTLEKAPTVPPGISQASDNFTSNSLVNNFGVDGVSQGLSHMNLGGGSGVIHPSRFEQPWRAPAAANKPHLTSTLAAASPFNNHNLINAGVQRSMLAGGNVATAPSSYGVSMHQGGEFARAPGPASSMMDNNMTPRPFGMANRSSTWSAFGTPGPSEPEPEWPKMSTGGISAAANQTQSSNAFDMVPADFDNSKPWPTRIDIDSSMFMKRLEDESDMNSAGATVQSFGGSYVSKSPTGSQYESSGIGTWSPVVKGGRSDSKWGDGSDGGRGGDGRFDDGTAIWGSPAQNKPPGVEWDKSGDPHGNNDRSRSFAGNDQTYRSQQSSSSTSLLMSSSNTSPPNQQGRNQQTMKQASSHNFDQVQQQQSNALSSQANTPNRVLGSSSNLPSTEQLKHVVQQIQLAVQAGHLNPQILNQPLAPVTLQLLYQLLQQIKMLHQLQLQASPQLNKPGSQQPGAVNVHITKTKQNILNLQNQIAAQQAVYLKQTQAHNISSRQPTMPNLATGGLGSGIGAALPPGISQSGDNYRSNIMVNNYGADGTGNSLGGHIRLGGAGVLPSARFDQPWRGPSTAKQHQASSMGSGSFANNNLLNQAPTGAQKSMIASGNGTGGSSAFGVGMHQGGEFARAPGPASSMMDNNMTPRPFGMANRSSTWSAFGTPGPSEPEPEWPKMSTGGISAAANQTQSSNAFDMVPEFEPGKPWRGSMLMKSVEDDPTMTPASMARSLAPQRKTIWSDEIL